MLGDDELLDLDSRLKNYAHASRQHLVNQDKLLEDFHRLIIDYEQLRSDYAEEKTSRQKYKKIAHGQERDPFVLVLVDGDSYIFRDQYIRAGANGGVTAAQNLNGAIKELLQSRLPPNEVDQCRVMVRIYANLSGLSKCLAKTGLVGQEARSLAPFTSSFTRAQDLFDFVDAGDKKETADFKIREIFRLFAESNQCKHIFFAGCHDVGYLSLLTQYRGKSDRITLLKASSFHNEFASLDLPVRELPTCFRSTPLGGGFAFTSSSALKGKALAKAPAGTGVKKICTYYSKGVCKYGDACLNEHIGKPEAPESSQRPKKCEKRLNASQVLQQYPALTVRSSAATPASVPSKPSAVLPETRPAEATAQGQMIPVNKNGDRLEVLCEQPSAEAWQAYFVRKEKQKVCNSHHLAGRCENGPDCVLDHTELEPLALSTLRWILKKNPCHKGSTCRDPTCYLGHLCQIDDCRGGSGCRFKANKHMQNLDFKVASWVEPEFAPATPAAHTGSVAPAAPAAPTAPTASAASAASPTLSFSPTRENGWFSDNDSDRSPSSREDDAVQLHLF